MLHPRYVLNNLLGIVLTLAGCGGNDSSSSRADSDSEAGGSSVGLIEEIDTVELRSVVVDPALNMPVELSVPDEGLTVTVVDPAVFHAAQTLTASAVSTPLPGLSALQAMSLARSARSSWNWSAPSRAISPQRYMCCLAGRAAIMPPLLRGGSRRHNPR